MENTFWQIFTDFHFFKQKSHFKDESSQKSGFIFSGHPVCCPVLVCCFLLLCLKTRSLNGVALRFTCRFWSVQGGPKREATLWLVDVESCMSYWCCEYCWVSESWTAASCAVSTTCLYYADILKLITWLNLQTLVQENVRLCGGVHCTYAHDTTFKTLYWAQAVIVPHRIIWSWYTGRRLVGCYIWYSDEGTGRGRSPPRPLIGVPNITAQPSTASVPNTVLLYNGQLLCSINVRVKGLTTALSCQSNPL